MLQLPMMTSHDASGTGRSCDYGRNVSDASHCFLKENDKLKETDGILCNMLDHVSELILDSYKGVC